MYWTTLDKSHQLTHLEAITWKTRIQISWNKSSFSFQLLSKLRMPFFLSFFLNILIKFRVTNNYSTKAKGAWKYITTPKTYTKRRDTNIAEIVTKYLATKG